MKYYVCMRSNSEGESCGKFGVFHTIVTTNTSSDYKGENSRATGYLTDHFLNYLRAVTYEASHESAAAFWWQLFLFSLIFLLQIIPQSLRWCLWHWTPTSSRPNCSVTRSRQNKKGSKWEKGRTHKAQCLHVWHAVITATRSLYTKNLYSAAFPSLFTVRLATFWTESGHHPSPAKLAGSFPAFFFSFSITLVLKSSYVLRDMVAQPSSFLVQEILVWVFFPSGGLMDYNLTLQETGRVQGIKAVRACQAKFAPAAAKQGGISHLSPWWVETDLIADSCPTNFYQRSVKATVCE